MFFAAQDAVTVKAVNNLASCCVKCLAFSVDENGFQIKMVDSFTPKLMFQASVSIQ